MIVEEDANDLLTNVESKYGGVLYMITQLPIDYAETGQEMSSVS